MANQTAIADWLVENIDTYDISFTECLWPKKYGFPFFDFECNLKIDEKNFIGRGSSFNRDEAIIKSFVEATERLNLNGARYSSSSGIASHFDLEKAKQHATSELIERDSFLCHFLTKTPFINMKQEEVPRNISNWISKFQNCGVDIIFRRMCSPEGQSCVIACAFGGKAAIPFGLLVATACDKHPEDAMLKAFFEVSRALSHKIETGLPTELTFNQWHALDKHKIMDHFRLSLNGEFAAHFRERYIDLTSEGNVAPIDISTIKHNLITEKQETLKGLPLITVRAFSAIAQEMFWGNPRKEILNLKRLSQFKGIPLSIELLTEMPHPFR